MDIIIRGVEEKDGQYKIYNKDGTGGHWYINKESAEQLSNQVERVVSLAASPSGAKSELLPCPFCGSDAEFEQLGTYRKSMIIKCTECGCALETNEIYQNDNFDYLWNKRAKL